MTTDVERRDRLSPEEFIEHYLVKNRPVVITDALSDAALSPDGEVYVVTGALSKFQLQLFRGKPDGVWSASHLSITDAMSPSLAGRDRRYGPRRLHHGSSSPPAPAPPRREVS